MEPQKNFGEQIEQIYASRNLNITKEIAQLLKQCKNRPQDLKALLDQLNGASTPINTINFQSWSNFARMLFRAVAKNKNDQILEKFGNYLAKGVNNFVPYQIGSNNYKTLEPLLKICRKAKFAKPAINPSNSKNIALYLQGQLDQNWSNQLVQYINNEVLVDKKNQNPNALRINPTFGKFISKHFSTFVPQLERLMVRSENNIQVLVEFLESCGDQLSGVGQQAVGLINKYKNIFQNKPELSLRFVKALTQGLNEQKYFIQAFQFIKGLINSEHNAKRKIINFRMLEGIVEAQKRYKHSQKIVNEIVGCVILSWAKFTQQSEAVFVIQLLNQLLPEVSQPGPQIAQLCKQSLKSTNKYILICMGLTLSFSYKKPEYFDKFASVKQCFNTLKKSLPEYLKKKQASWHFILPIMNFVSTYELDLVQDLSQIESLFKKSCLALPPIQQRDALDLIIAKYLKFLQKNADGENSEINENIYLTIAILLENNRKRQIWKASIDQLNENQKVQLVYKGLYPLVYLQSDPIASKNRNNKFVSLARYVLLNLKQQITEQQSQKIEKIVCVANYANVKLPKILDLKDGKVLEQIAQKYILLSMINLKGRQQNEKEYITPFMHDLHLKLTNSLFALSSVPGLALVNQLLQKLLNKQHYQKDRSFIQSTQKKQKEIKAKHFEGLVNPCKQALAEMQLFVDHKPIKRKIYLNPILDAKMMSQAEVKEEQYRQHFNSMLEYLNHIISEILLKNIKNATKEDKTSIWDKNFDGFVHIVQYPQLRMPVFRVVKSSFMNFHIGTLAKEQQKSYFALKKLFLRYSNFFADFYSIRGAHMTPSVALMQKSQRFYNQFLSLDYKILPKQHFSIRFINDLSLYVLQNMEFDLSVKQQALNFFNACIQKGQEIQQVKELYTFLVKNLNIISASENIENVLYYCMKKVDCKRYGQMFAQILNYVNKTKRLILKTLLRVCEEEKGENSYEPTFEDYIKLRILALDDSTFEEITQSASKLLVLKSKNTASITTTIAHFDMKHFIKNNTKDTIQKLCKFMKESINPENINDVFDLALTTAEQLYDEDFDQQGLEFLPYFLSINLETIPEKYLHKIFQILVLKFTANEDFATLSKMSVDIGIDIIKQHANKSGEKMLMSMESYLTKAKGISNIVFLGVLAPYLKGNKNLNVIEKRITELFKGDSQTQQRSIAKCMPDLMSFFKNPDQIVAKIFQDISQMEEKVQSGQSYLASGLLKGLGPKLTLTYLQRLIAEEYPSKTKSDKIGRCYLLRAFVQNFGRVTQLKAFRIIQILLHYMSDSNEQVRNVSKSVAQVFVTKMSSFSIRQLLPHLLSGLENEPNWRIKISYIWILGIMANCSAKQLQTSLPIIVPTLSGCLSNPHPAIRDKASQALSLIGQTIKNPEISNSIDVLIEALENPFQKSSKAIDILLKTRFSHYIDPPSLSIIVPIIDYCLRGRVSQLKEGACQVIGSISELILNPSDMLPYLKYVSPGMKTALTDPLPQIRSIAAMAIGKITAKIGADAAKQYFSFVYEIIDSTNSNTTQKTGAAQAFAEIMCSQGYEYFQESLTQIFAKLSEPSKSIPKQGYILVFLYVPGIRREQFQGFIKQVNENTYCYVSDEDESLRNSSMQVSKVLINNYGISHTDLLLDPLCEGIFQANWRKRNAALILLGQLLNILKYYMFNAKDYSKNQYYYQALMAVYIMKDDELEMPRMTANQVWNTYIENTPKTIRSGLHTLIKMWTKFTHAAGGVVFKNIIGFTSKYGQNYFTQMLQYLEQFSTQPEHREGVFQVLGQLFKRMSQQFLSKPAYRSMIRKFFDNNIFKVDGIVRESLTKSLSLYVQKMHEQEYFQNLILPKIDKMAELNDQIPQYTQMLHLLRDLLHTTSVKVVDRLISKITQAPLSQFKIEVITNNTDKIANNLYSSFKVPATEGMLQQIISLIDKPNKADRLSLLAYCLNQVSIRLNSKYKNMYINMLIRTLRQFKNKKNQIKSTYLGVVDKILDMIVFFLTSIELSEIQSLEELIGEISPHIFDGTDSIKANAHKIFILLISDHKTNKTGTYYKQMIVSLDNQRLQSQNKNVTIWNEEQILKDYISILVKGLVYGNFDNIQDNLELTKFLIKNADPKLLNPLIPRVLGPIIRVASYPLFQRQKQRLLQFIKEMYSKGYDGLLEVYNFQVISVCLRLINESKLLNKKGNDITEQISKTLFYVITKQTNNRNRQLLMSFILEKAKGEILSEIMYRLLDQIIRNSPETLSNAIYTKIKNTFTDMLASAQSKNSVKATYYLSKTVAMISVLIFKQQAEAKQVLTYEDLILHLQKTYYRKQALPKLDKIELLIKQSPREKVYYILKCIHECCLANTRTEEVYTNYYVKHLVPEALSGFEDIVDVLEYFN